MFYSEGEKRGAVEASAAGRLNIDISTLKQRILHVVIMFEDSRGNKCKEPRVEVFFFVSIRVKHLMLLLHTVALPIDNQLVVPTTDAPLQANSSFTMKLWFKRTPQGFCRCDIMGEVGGSQGTLVHNTTLFCVIVIQK